MLGESGLGAVVETLIEASEDGIFVLDRDERVVVWNHACERLTGFPSAEVVGPGRGCDDVFRCHRIASAGGAATVACAISDLARRAGADVREEILVVSRTGERRWVESSFAGVAGAGGARTHTVGVLRAIDARKRAEAELERARAQLRDRARELLQAEKMSTIGQLAAGLAHELNTPLNTILGYSQLIAKRAADPEIVQEARAAETATKRCRDIVKSLLDFSRRSDGFRAPRRLAKVIERALDLLGHELEARGVTAVLDLDPGPWDVVAAENQLEQALLNLARNALDAMPQGGRISVRTSPAAERGSVEIAFSDTGLGMAPDVLSHAFEPFFTTKAPGVGTGLGLAIVARIVEELGGDIDAASEPGRGATFTLRLPLHQGAA